MGGGGGGGGGGKSGRKVCLWVGIEGTQNRKVRCMWKNKRM